MVFEQPYYDTVVILVCITSYTSERATLQRLSQIRYQFNQPTIHYVYIHCMYKSPRFKSLIKKSLYILVYFSIYLSTKSAASQKTSSQSGPSFWLPVRHTRLFFRSFFPKITSFAFPLSKHNVSLSFLKGLSFK